MSGGRTEERPLLWVGNSRVVVRGFPKQVREVVGQALYVAQRGSKHPDSKPLKGFGGASVVEIVADYASDTYRVVYTVRFRRAVYVLHAFQKKSTKGIATPQKDIRLIKQRLRTAEEHYKSNYGGST